MLESPKSSVVSIFLQLFLRIVVFVLAPAYGVAEALDRGSRLASPIPSGFFGSYVLSRVRSYGYPGKGKSTHIRFNADDANI